jgi:hypothetical protein
VDIIKLEMSENDIIKAMKSCKFSPIKYLASRILREDLHNIDIDKDGIVIWNSDNSDYVCYRYCSDYLDIVSNFIDEWEDYTDNYLENFNSQPITFCVEAKK